MERYPTDPCPSNEFVQGIAFPVARTNYPNGTRQVARLTTVPISSFVIAYGSLYPAEIDILWDFYIARQGVFELFEYELQRTGEIFRVSYADEISNRTQFQYNLERTGVNLVQVY